MHFQILLSLLPLALAGPGSSVASRATPEHRVLYQFPAGTLIRSAALRSNGQLLLTTALSDKVWGFDPASASSGAILTASIPSVNYTLGITELSKDEFAVTGGKIYNDSAVPGSSGIFNFSMGGEVVRTDFAFTEPELPVIAGMTALPSAPKTIMAAAPFNGSVVRIDILTGKMDIIIKDKQLEPTKWAKTGVCAVKVGDDGYLYYAVQSQGTFGRVKITEKGDKAGDLESINISSNPGPEGGYMAFALDGKGHAYAVERPNKLMKIDIKGRKQKTLIKGDDLKNPSAVVISKDGKKLYITTIGDYATSAGGKIVEVDI